MQSEKITLVGRLKAVPGKEAALRNALLTLVPFSRAEAGCISYEAITDDRPTTH